MYWARRPEAADADLAGEDPPCQGDRLVEALAFLFRSQRFIPARVEAADYPVDGHWMHTVNQRRSQLLAGVVRVHGLHEGLVDGVGNVLVTAAYARAELAPDQAERRVADAVGRALTKSRWWWSKFPLDASS